MLNRRQFVARAASTLTAAALAPQAFAVSPRPRLRMRPDSDLQAILDEAARSLGVVGAQMAVFDGERFHECVYGQANLERQHAVTTDTLFQIGSTTKVFNAAVIMALVDEGVLELDTPVKRWIPGFRLADGDATERTTLRHLLSMSSGIDNGTYDDHGRGDDAIGTYVAKMADIPQVFPPGTAFGYSNASTVVSGYAAVCATGKNWETLLAEKILGPLGLKQSACFPEDLLFHPVALGYAHMSVEPRRIPYWGLPRSMVPAGSTLCCSAGDLVRFARMFLSEGEAESGGQVLSASGVETMHAPQVDLPAKITAQKWCTGPYWKRWGGEVIYGHSGTNSGGSSMLLWCPAKNVAIATITNVPRQGYPLADRIFDTVFPEVFGIEKPTTPKPGSVTPAESDPSRYLGRYESYGNVMTFTEDGGDLVANVYSGAAGPPARPSMTSKLIPLGDDRFLPADPAMGGNRGWDVAFWGTDGAGKATHFLNGVFAMRRVG